MTNLLKLFPDFEIESNELRLISTENSSSETLTLSNPVGGLTLGDTVNAMTIVDNDNNNLPVIPAIKVGPEFQVSNTGGAPSVASLTNGGFIATWADRGQIFGQQYDANGSPVGTELVIDQRGVPSVTYLTDGGFVITWSTVSSGIILFYTISAQRYDASSNPVGATFVVDSNGYAPSVATLNDGGFVVIWNHEKSNTTYGQRYDASSNPVGSEFGVNGGSSSVASFNNGGFIVTFTAYEAYSFDLNIYGQRYDANGNAIGNKFIVNTSTDGTQSNSSVASLTDGGYVVVWTSEVTLSNQTSSNIYGQRYDLNGNRVGTEFQVNTNTDRKQLNPTITSLTNGGFAVTWLDLAIDHDVNNTNKIKSQQYDALGNLVGSAQINLNSTINAPSPDASFTVATLNNGELVVNWSIYSLGIVLGQILRPVDYLGIFEIDKLARSGYTDGLTFDAVEVGGLPIPALYDESYYLHQNPDVAAAVSSGLLSNGYTHFVNFGQYEGRNPSTLYNEAFYLSQNLDVADALTGGFFESGFEHYALFGQQEGRSPSAVFNETAYRTSNLDVNDAITNGQIRSGFEHYLEYGRNEARYPLNYLYDERSYLTQYPDVADAVAQGQFQDGFEHYINIGQSERRNPSSLFNESRYLMFNPDVEIAVSNDVLASGFEHYVLFGRFEGRTI